MSQSSVSAALSQPADSLQTAADCFYILMKYSDWLVIGGVTGCGRARTMVCIQALFFSRPNLASWFTLACRTQKK